MIVTCECGAKLKLGNNKIAGKCVKVRCPRCGTVLNVKIPVVAAPEVTEGKINQPVLSTRPLVLVAHDSGVVRDLISNVLLDAGFRVDTAADGVAAFKKATEIKPQGMVLDVGIPGMYGYELCSRLKEDPNTGSIKIVLISSVYDMRRYKRTPESLYGADDYVEKHHIHDLPEKLRKLLFQENHQKMPVKNKASFHQELLEMSLPPAKEFESPMHNPGSLAHKEKMFPIFIPHPSQRGSKDNLISDEAFSLDASIFQSEEYNIARVDEKDPDAVEKAKRFARIIVSDIALYNQEMVVNGIINGTFYELLKNDIQEGRELYEKRVPAAIKQKKDYFSEAFDNFITATKKKFSINE